MKGNRWLVRMALVGACLCGIVSPAAAQEALRVMTFNIRYGTADDGPNRWEVRKDFLAEVIAQEDPDVIGLQEALHDQIEFLLGRLPGYALIGVGRDDGKTAGEYSAILYRQAKLTVEQSETFWLSDTPNKVASATWGNRIPRICTWGRFRTASGTRLYVYNVHLDHQSQPSRERATALLRERITARRPAAPFIVTGDFNAGEDNPAVTNLTANGFTLDTFRVKHAGAAAVGTFNGFTPGRIEGEKIDYVLVGPRIAVEDAEIIRTMREERYPSDHFPVTAHLHIATK